MHIREKMVPMIIIDLEDDEQFDFTSLESNVTHRVCRIDITEDWFRLWRDAGRSKSFLPNKFGTISHPDIPEVIAQKIVDVQARLSALALVG